MYSKNEEDNTQAKKMIEMKDDLKSQMKKVYLEREQLDSKISRLGRELAKVNMKLKGLCEHEWTREPYVYSELYCQKCGVFK
jgi:hypothetical protein